MIYCRSPAYIVPATIRMGNIDAFRETDTIPSKRHTMKLFGYHADFRFVQDSLVILTSTLLICVAIGWFFWTQWMVP